MRHEIRLFAVCSLVAIGLLYGWGAAGVPEGTLRGIVIDADIGKPVSGSYSLFLLEPNPEAGPDNYALKSTETATLDSKGRFVLSDVSPGKYSLMLLNPLDFNQSFFFEDKSGKRIVVNLAEGKGIDLGEVFISAKPK